MVFLLGLLNSSCYWTRYTGAQWHRSESFETITSTDNSSHCYVTENGVDVWQHGLTTCVEEGEVEWQVANLLKQLKIDPDSAYGIKVVFSASTPDCGAFQECGGMANEEKMLAVVGLVDWRRTLRHEITHIFIPNDPNHHDYRWEFLRLMRRVT